MRDAEELVGDVVPDGDPVVPWGLTADDLPPKDRARKVVSLHAKVDQDVWIIWTYSGWYGRGLCPACGGTGTLVGQDGASYSCGASVDDGQNRWHCYAGKREAYVEGYPRVYEARVIYVEATFHHNHTRMVYRLAWEGGPNCSRDHGDFDPDDFFLTREEAERALARKKWEARESVREEAAYRAEHPVEG